MACTNTGPFDGGTWTTPTIVNPDATGGTYTAPSISNATLTGPITMDENAINSIVNAICDKIGQCIEANDINRDAVAAVFKNCAGAPLTPDVQVATCEELDGAIEAALVPNMAVQNPTVTEAPENGILLPTTMVGEDRTQILGRPAGYIEAGDWLIPVYRKP